MLLQPSSGKHHFSVTLTVYRDGYFSIRTEEWIYPINICAPANFTRIHASDCPDTGAKAYQGYIGGGCFPMTASGLDDTSLRLIDERNATLGVVLGYANFMYRGYSRQVDIYMYCSPENKIPYKAYFIDEKTATNQSWYKFKMYTSYACPVKK